MANTTVLIRKSGTGGNQPSSLEFGELALNYADGKLFFKRANNYIQSIDLNFTATSNATSNIAIIQGIDDWQNTRITAIDSYVQYFIAPAYCLSGVGYFVMYSSDSISIFA